MNRAITLEAGWLFALVPFALAGITWLWCVLIEAAATMHAWWMRRTAEESLAVARRVSSTTRRVSRCWNCDWGTHADELTLVGGALMCEGCASLFRAA